MATYARNYLTYQKYHC